MTALDWAKLQSFVAVAEHGSLSAAARATGASQPTLSRHIAMLEEEVGLRLFDRRSDGLSLTATGAEIFEKALAMAQAANELELIATGRSEQVSGTVRITASQVMAAYSLPQILTALRIAEPQIAIELVASNETDNLLKREADIAVRMYRPLQNDVITRKVGDLTLGVFASRSYLERRGRPEITEDLLSHDVIGFDRSDEMVAGFKSAGVDVSRDFFALRTDAHFVHPELVRAGFGVGVIETGFAQSDPELVRLFPEAMIRSLPIWLTAHAELRSSVRVRRAFDFLAEKLEAKFGARP
ncbi:LysR family transcriptional regulator [bacterium]|nr:LysR family transcriptional regulator [bacterium]